MDEIRLIPILRGEKISVPVIEPDGARTGFRTVPATCDGFLIEGIPDVSAFVDYAEVVDVVEELRRIRRNPSRYGR